MKLTKYEHACMVIEKADVSGRRGRLVFAASSDLHEDGEPATSATSMESSGALGDPTFAPWAERTAA